MPATAATATDGEIGETERLAERRGNFSSKRATGQTTFRFLAQDQ